MLRRRVRHGLLLVLTALVMAAIFGSGRLLPAALAETNPTYLEVPVKYLDGPGQGPEHSATIIEFDVAYNPEFDGWCSENHRTAAGNKFHHAHMTQGFPFLDTFREPNVWVTAQMCDWYWDYAMNVEDPPEVGWERMTTATMAYNCHGFVFAGVFPGGARPPLWIADNEAGQGKIIADEYTGPRNPVNGCVASWTAHSFKVLVIQEILADPPWHLERHTEDKFGSSGIYEFKDIPDHGLQRGFGKYYTKKD